MALWIIWQIKLTEQCRKWWPICGMCLWGGHSNSNSNDCLFQQSLNQAKTNLTWPSCTLVLYPIRAEIGASTQWHTDSNQNKWQWRRANELETAMTFLMSDTVHKVLLQYLYPYLCLLRLQHESLTHASDTITNNHRVKSWRGNHSRLLEKKFQVDLGKCYIQICH